MTAAPVRTPPKGFTLADASREFWTHPTPWMIGGTLIVTLVTRILVADWQFTDTIVPLAMLVAFPFLEWVIHVVVLHWRPRRIGRFTIDPLLARKHREHHLSPRDVPAIFIPWQALLWALPFAVAISLLAFPRPAMGLTFLGFLMALGLGYEWCHYLIHSDYKPKRRWYRAVYRHHRLHHFKNEHYWFTVTSAGTADRVLGTNPDPATIPTSPTAKNLHGARA